MGTMRKAASPCLDALRHHPWQIVSLGMGLLLAPVILARTGASEPVATPTAKIPAAKPELHTFTDLQGHTLNAQVLSLVGTTVHLKRDDDNKIEAPLASFIKADQAYVIDFALKQHTAHGDVVFGVSYQPQTTSTVSSKIVGGTHLGWHEAYKVTLKNQTQQTFADLQVRVIVFKVLLQPDVSSNVESPILLFGQTHDLDLVPAAADTTFLTDALNMQQILANDGGYFPTVPAAHAETDKLLAFWLRVYDSNNYLAQEWCSSPDLMKQQRWEDAWAMATGQARGTRRGSQ